MSIQTLQTGQTYIKAENLSSTRILRGNWDVYRKIDGVRAFKSPTGAISRNSKKLFNLNKLHFSDAEIFNRDWNTTISMVRTESPVDIEQSMVYELTDGKVDKRLFLGTKTNPQHGWLNRVMKKYVALGDEGIVIRQGSKWYKIVPTKYADVRVTGVKKGTGKNKDVLGSIQTTHGSVGSFITQLDEDGIELSDFELRKRLWLRQDELIGSIIEVAYREKTSTGKLRFPKLRRLRWDKSSESV